MDHDPAHAVTELILASRPVAHYIADVVDIEIKSGDQREKLVSRFLWKFGFNPYRYGDEYPTLRRRITDFRDVLTDTDIVRTEADRERVRSSGVNLFVSVEHFLEDLIAYNVWLLASDHFIDVRNRLRFDPRAALKKTGEVLSDENSSGGHNMAWDSNGANALGTLLEYLSRARH